MLRQILLDIWNVRELRRERDALHSDLTEACADLIAMQRTVDGTEDNRGFYWNLLREVVTIAHDAEPKGDSVKEAHAALGVHTGWRYGDDIKYGLAWHEKQKQKSLKREAFLRRLS